MRRVAVVFDVLSRRRIGQPEPVFLAHLRHDGAQSLVLDLYRRIRVRTRGLEGLDDAGRDEVRRGIVGAVLSGLLDKVRISLQRDDRVRVSLQYALDGGRRVEARGDGAAEGFDAGDGGGGRAGDDNVDCGAQLIGVLRRKEALVRVR